VYLVVFLWGSVVGKGGPCARLFDQKGTEFDTDVSHFAPVLAPTVANDPVLALFLVVAPSYDGDNVVDLGTGHGGDTTGVLEDWGGVNTAGNWSTGKDFFLHGVLAIDGSVLGNGCVWEAVQTYALSTHVGKGAAGLGNVLGGAGGVKVRANTFFGLAGAG